MKQAVFVILNQYADWEGAYLSSQLSQNDDWHVSTASVTKRVQSIGGFTTLVDQQIDELTQPIDLLVLIGGNSWNIESSGLKALIKQRLVEGQPVAAICGAVDFLAKQGLLTDYRHTGNAKYLWQGYSAYQNAADFVEQQAVRDRNLVTANGTAALDFTRLVLEMIDFADSETIKKTIALQHDGFYQYCQQYGNPYI